MDCLPTSYYFDERSRDWMEQGLGQAQAQWLPLLEIFLKSASPVGEASHWLHTHTLPHHQKTHGPPALWKFVPHLLTKNVLFQNEQHAPDQPTGASASASSSIIGRCMWIETLPTAMQSSILTFLSAEHARFRKKDLQVLVQTLLAKPDLDFWVRRAAENLVCIDAGHNAYVLSTVNREPEMEAYNALPEWLEDYRRGSYSLFPWIPLDSMDVKISAIDVPETSEQQGIHQTQSKQMPIEEPQKILLDRNPCSPQIREHVGERIEDSKHATDYASEIHQGTNCISVEAAGSGVTSIDVDMVDQEDVDSKSSLDPQFYAQALSLREELIKFESSGNVSSFAEKMLALCTTADSRQVLSIIKPWEVDDEVTFQLVQALLKEQDGYAWSTDMLCSLILPKLLSLREPASRTLITTVLHAVKVHQRATVDALLLPSMLYKEGLNAAVCEVLHRISKDCLHSDHVSSFIHKLLCENPQQSAICLPCHRAELSPCLVWSESVFTLFQNILNQQMSLTQDAIDLLVLALDDVAEQFSKSLKFGNFLLCLINKYPSLLKHHKVLLQRVSERTSTFMTKPIMTKLACL